MKVDNLIASTIADQEQDSAMMLFDIIVDEGLDSAVYPFLHIVDL